MASTVSVVTAAGSSDNNSTPPLLSSISNVQFCYLQYYDLYSIFYNITVTHNTTIFSKWMKNLSTLTSSNDTILSIPFFDSTTRTMTPSNLTAWEKILTVWNILNNENQHIEVGGIHFGSYEDVPLTLSLTNRTDANQTLVFATQICSLSTAQQECPSGYVVFNVTGLINATTDAAARELQARRTSFNMARWQPAVPWWEPTVTTSWRTGFIAPGQQAPLRSFLISDLTQTVHDVDCGAVCWVNSSDRCGDYVAHLARVIGCYIANGADVRGSAVMSLCESLYRSNLCNRSVTEEVCRVINYIRTPAAFQDVPVFISCGSDQSWDRSRGDGLTRRDGIAAIFPYLPAYSPNASSSPPSSLFAHPWVYGPWESDDKHPAPFQVTIQCTQCHMFIAAGLTSHPFAFVVLGAMINAALIIFVSLVVDHYLGQAISRTFASVVMILLPFHGQMKRQQKELLLEHLRPQVVSTDDLLEDAKILAAPPPLKAPANSMVNFGTEENVEGTAARGLSSAAAATAIQETAVDDAHEMMNAPSAAPSDIESLSHYRRDEISPEFLNFYYEHVVNCGTRRLRNAADREVIVAFRQLYEAFRTEVPNVHNVTIADNEGNPASSRTNLDPGLGNDEVSSSGNFLLIGSSPRVVDCGVPPGGAGPLSVAGSQHARVGFGAAAVGRLSSARARSASTTSVGAALDVHRPLLRHRGGGGGYSGHGADGAVTPRGSASHLLRDYVINVDEPTVAVFGHHHHLRQRHAEGGEREGDGGNAAYQEERHHRGGTEPSHLGANAIASLTWNSDLEKRLTALLVVADFVPAQIREARITRQVLCPKVWLLIFQVVCTYSLFLFYVFETNHDKSELGITDWNAYQVVYFRMFNSSLPLTTVINVFFRLLYDRGTNTAMLYVAFLAIAPGVVTHVLPAMVVYFPVTALVALMLYAVMTLHRHVAEQVLTKEDAPMKRFATHLIFRVVMVIIIVTFVQCFFNFAVLFYDRAWPASHDAVQNRGLMTWQQYIDVVYIELYSKINWMCAVETMDNDVQNKLQLLYATLVS